MYYDNFYMRGCYYQDLNTIPTLVKQHAQLIDLRKKEYYEASHIPGFINIPFHYFNQYLNHINKNNPVYLLCDNGHLSEIIASDLCLKGYRAYSFIGGYNHYQHPIDLSLY